ncbi:hypothetical protein DRN74_03370, partial [Candidatus Micrarchaeota archaeon]
MANNSNVWKILEKIYNAEEENFKVNKENRKRINLIVENIDSQKAVATALITSLVKKILNSNQDIRFHKVDFGKPEWNSKGYSARTFDTHYITPWMKKRFPRWAMKESAWLTRSIEQPHPFTMDFPGHIKKKDVKKAFLEILNTLEEKIESTRNQKKYAYELLKYIIFKMKKRYTQQMRIVSFEISKDLKKKRH